MSGIMLVRNYLNESFRRVLIATVVAVLLVTSSVTVSSFVVVSIQSHNAPGAFLPSTKRVMEKRSGVSSGNTQHRRLFLWDPLPRRGGLAAKKKTNNWDDKSLTTFCAEQESRAIAASESWAVEATGFLEPEQSSGVIDILEGRADVACLSVGSYRGSGNSRRVRCVFANPDLGYDKSTADTDYVCYLKIDNVALSQCDPWPNVLVKIGLSLENVGDVFSVSNESKVYLAVSPESEKTCVRLLPKELPGTGVTVTKLSREDIDDQMAAINDSDGEVLQDMEVQRVDKRK